jgi:hypothetical protein
MGATLRTEYVEEQTGSAVDDGGVGVEIPDGTDVPTQVYQCSHVVHSDGDIDCPDQVEGRESCLCLCLFERYVGADYPG